MDTRRHAGARGEGQGHVPPRCQRSPWASTTSSWAARWPSISCIRPTPRSVPDGASSRSRGSATSSTSRSSPRASGVIDLGSGSGMDVFFAATGGPDRERRGIDFTAEQLDEGAAARGGVRLSQVEFREGRIEQLPADDATFDCVISNGVINLSPDKERVFAEAFESCGPEAGWLSPTSSATSR